MVRETITPYLSCTIRRLTTPDVDFAVTIYFNDSAQYTYYIYSYENKTMRDAILDADKHKQMTLNNLGYFNITETI